MYLLIGKLLFNATLSRVTRIQALFDFNLFQQNLTAI